MKNLINRLLLLSILLLTTMILQSSMGLAFPHLYEDVGFVKMTWFGNDLITLCLAVPIFAIALKLERKELSIGRILWLGTLAYSIYNYSFYLFGARLNSFFLLYLTAYLLSVIIFILLIINTDARLLAVGFKDKTPVKPIGGYYILLSLCLSIIWVVMWFSYIFSGNELPIPVEAFQVVAVLDITLMAPAIFAGGFLIIRKKPWGYIISSIAGIQGSLYLVILSLNSIIFYIRGISDGPEEIFIWLLLFILTILNTLVLLRNFNCKLKISK